MGVEGSGTSAVPGVEEAWRELRRRLADHAAGMEPRETLVVSAQVAATEDGPGPYVMVCSPAGSADGWRLEAVSNGYLDSAHRLDEVAEEALCALGWSPPTYLPGEEGADGSANWHLDLPVHDLERGAWLLVRTLREVYGVVHPAFLDSSALDLDGLRARRPLPPRPREARDPAERRAAVDALPVVRPDDAEHLARLVRETVAALGEEVDDDEDGDLLWTCGEASVAYVHVDEERPAVHLFSVLVVDGTLPDGGLAALDLVSGRLPWLAVRLAGDRLVVHHELCAMPFVPQHLVAWLARLAVEIDDVATEAAVLMGGRRFLEDEPAEAPAPSRAEVELDEQLAVVSELLVDGPVQPRVVAAVFAHDRGALVRRLVGLRQGRLAVLSDDLDGLLDALRAGLRWIVDEPDRVADARRRARRRVAPRPTVQSLLIGDEPDLFESDAG